jgi:hypothetical protein
MALSWRISRALLDLGVGGHMHSCGGRNLKIHIERLITFCVPICHVDMA